MSGAGGSAGAVATTSSSSSGASTTGTASTVPAWAAGVTVSTTVAKLSFKNIRDEGSPALAELLTSATGSSSEWQATNITDNTTSHSLPIHLAPTVSKLDISCNSIGAEGVAALAHALKSHKTVGQPNAVQ